MPARPPTPQQFAALSQQLRPVLNKLNRLRQRLEARGYLPGDPYYDVVLHATDAVHALCVKTHYASCDGGVGGAEQTTREPSSSAG
jgi:hypothetical protein